MSEGGEETPGEQNENGVDKRRVEKWSLVKKWCVCRLVNCQQVKTFVLTQSTRGHSKHISPAWTSLTAAFFMELLCKMLPDNILGLPLRL